MMYIRHFLHFPPVLVVLRVLLVRKKAACLSSSEGSQSTCHEPASDNLVQVLGSTHVIGKRVPILQYHVLALALNCGLNRPDVQGLYIISVTPADFVSCSGRARFQEVEAFMHRKIWTTSVRFLHDRLTKDCSVLVEQNLLQHLRKKMVFFESRFDPLHRRPQPFPICVARRDAEHRLLRSETVSANTHGRILHV